MVGRDGHMLTMPQVCCYQKIEALNYLLWTECVSQNETTKPPTYVSQMWKTNTADLACIRHAMSPINRYPSRLP